MGGSEVVKGGSNPLPRRSGRGRARAGSHPPTPSVLRVLRFGALGALGTCGAKRCAFQKKIHNGAVRKKSAKRDFFIIIRIIFQYGSSMTMYANSMTPMTRFGGNLEVEIFANAVHIPVSANPKSVLISPCTVTARAQYRCSHHVI